MKWNHFCVLGDDLESPGVAFGEILAKHRRLEKAVLLDHTLDPLDAMLRQLEAIMGQIKNAVDHDEDAYARCCTENNVRQVEAIIREGDVIHDKSERRAIHHVAEMAKDGTDSAHLQAWNKRVVRARQSEQDQKEDAHQESTTVADAVRLNGIVMQVRDVSATVLKITCTQRHAVAVPMDALVDLRGDHPRRTLQHEIHDDGQNDPTDHREVPHALTCGRLATSEEQRISRLLRTHCRGQGRLLLVTATALKRSHLDVRAHHR